MGNLVVNLPTVGDTQPLTMSSREIAELTGKEHRHVMRDIRNMLEQLGEVESKFGRYYIAANGKRNPEYHLPKDLTITLVSGYSPVLRHRIVTRWMELEEAQRRKNQIDLNDPYALRQVLLTYSEKVIELEHQRDGLQSIVGQHLHSLTDVARMLPGVNSMRVHGDLCRLGYLYRRAKGYRVYRQFSPYFVEKHDPLHGKFTIYATAKGKTLLGQLAEEGKLTKKAGHKTT